MKPHSTRLPYYVQLSFPLATEEWREIPGFDGHYEVSNMGRVRSWYWRKGNKRQERPIYNAPFVSNIGYVYYRLSYKKKGKNFAAHRLVLLTFVGESTLEVNHRDGDKSNNKLDNLEYMTHRDNIRHSVALKKRR